MEKEKGREQRKPAGKEPERKRPAGWKQGAGKEGASNTSGASLAGGWKRESESKRPAGWKRESESKRPAGWKQEPDSKRPVGWKQGSDKEREECARSLCPAVKRCGGCQYLGVSYPKQLEKKQKEIKKLLGGYGTVRPIHGMQDPFHYRNKVHAVFGFRKGETISGIYEEGTHRIVPVEHCLIEDKKADEIIGTIRGMLRSFRIRVYDEDARTGFLRHVLVRRGFATGQIMVVLVTASPVFPSKNHFVKALLEKHPEITTIVQNINDRGTSMVLGERESVLYGAGYIEDILCGCRFRISPRSFYQVNPVQTEYLYGKALALAGLTGKETVLDAYCGIGTIGIIAASHAKQVIGVEQNRDAVRDAVKNAKCNGTKNITFYCNDATRFMAEMARNGQSVDVVFMDPPRSGSTEEFIRSVAAVRAKRVVYVSCCPDTLARDLGIFRKAGYRMEEAWPVDLFPFTVHVETIVLLSNRKIKPDSHVRLRNCRKINCIF